MTSAPTRTVRSWMLLVMCSAGPVIESSAGAMQGRRLLAAHEVWSSPQSRFGARMAPACAGEVARQERSTAHASPHHVLRCRFDPKVEVQRYRAASRRFALWAGTGSGRWSEREERHARRARPADLERPAEKSHR